MMILADAFESVILRGLWGEWISASAQKLEPRRSRRRSAGTSQRVVLCLLFG